MVQDSSEPYPTLERWLYCSLDYDILMVEILFWYLFDTTLGNPMLAIALTYCVERFFRWLRATLGENNLSQKAMVDDRFLL